MKKSIVELMANTPVVKLKGRALTPPRGNLWGKLELGMPGQMKDRVAARIIEDAEASGRLRPGGIIAESSSGTMAEGLARVAAVKGYRLIIVTDPRIDAGSANKLRALGATLDIVEKYHPTGGWQQTRLERLKEVLKQNPGAYWPQQYDTASNPSAYSRGMAQELVSTFGKDIAAIVGTVGSGGSLCGTARGLRAEVPGVRVIAVDAVGSVQFHQPNRPRLQSGHSNSIIAGNIDYRVIDEAHWLADGECFNGCHELARREGIYGGGSSGAAYVVASWVAQQVPEGSNVIAILPDRGDRYGETIYSQQYLEEKGLVGIEAGAAPLAIRYGIDVAERWSFAALPTDGKVPFHEADVVTSRQLKEQLGFGDQA